MNKSQRVPRNTAAKRLLRASIAIFNLVLGTAMLTGGCASQPREAESMRDAKADFTAYKTFGWDESMNSETSGKPLSLLDNSIRTAITNELKRKGYEEAPAGTAADLLVAFETASAEKVKNNPFRIGVGVGSYGGSGGGGVSAGSTSVKNVKEGTLVVHAIDPARKAEVWQSRVTRELGKGNVEPSVVQGAVADVFRDFPVRTARP
jgi:uncharacterized protein DUF4136